MKRFIGLFVLGVLLNASVAYAKGADEAVTVRMEAYQIVLKNKVEKRVIAKEAKPGDLLEYVAIYHNNTDHAISNLKGTMPIPEGMILIVDSPRPRHVLASLNGKTFAAMPLKRRVKQADGSLKEVLVPLSEYRFLRWNMGVLQGEKSKNISARMQVTPLEQSAK